VRAEVTIINIIIIIIIIIKNTNVTQVEQHTTVQCAAVTALRRRRLAYLLRSASNSFQSSWKSLSARNDRRMMTQVRRTTTMAMATAMARATCRSLRCKLNRSG